MQYDENAEKYGYDGEMTPMKCDRLNAYKGDVTIPVYGTIADAEVYLKKDVDAAIAELKAENERLKKKMDDYHLMSDIRRVKIKELKRVLWIARAERAKAMYTYWHIKCIEGHLLYEHKWIVVERKCRAKAEEYK